MAKSQRTPIEKSDSELANIRHSLAHLLAAAVLELWPDAKHTIGPVIDNGFYYDFEFSKPISDKDLPKIEAHMRKILPTWSGFERRELSPADAKREFPDNSYKQELIEELTGKGETISFYKSGHFWDLCRGGHVEKMGAVDPAAFKLVRVAGAYWRGDEKRQQLTRIYGVAFKSKTELEDYLARMAEAAKRDHKILGRELDLFTFSELVGSGLPLWTPKGTLVRNLLDEFVWELRQVRGYERVEIPHITKKDLFVRSGHWEKFQDELFKITTREGHFFAMKPMNCPHHTQIFARRAWSYRDLPQRYESTTMCYRDEQSGELSGLSRARSFTQDDAHVFCRPEQTKAEFVKIWDIVEQFYGVFGFTLQVRLSLHDPAHLEKYLGDPKRWSDSEAMLRQIVKERGVDAVEAIGEAAFYGPKVDFMAQDSLGREWQVATIQIDHNMPERFGLFATDEHGQPEQVVMVHAAIMGSIERFLSILIEHFAGAFPLWLSPVQIQLIPVTSHHEAAVEKLRQELSDDGLRVSVDDANETVGNKIRKASHLKIPYLLVIGDKELDGPKLIVKVRGEKDTVEIAKNAFVKKTQKLIADRSLEL